MGTDVLRSADGVRMLQDHKMGHQGPWESHHHHKGITDLSPRKASVAYHHEEQGKKQEELGVLGLRRHRDFSCNLGRSAAVPIAHSWIPSYFGVLAPKGGAAPLQKKGENGYFRVNAEEEETRHLWTQMCSVL